MMAPNGSAIIGRPDAREANDVMRALIDTVSPSTGLAQKSQVPQRSQRARRNALNEV
jgi:hypothetical protein